MRVHASAAIARAARPDPFDWDAPAQGEELDGAARSGVAPQVETFPMEEADAAMSRVRRNAVRRRAVVRAA